MKPHPLADVSISLVLQWQPSHLVHHPPFKNEFRFQDLLNRIEGCLMLYLGSHSQFLRQLGDMEHKVEPGLCRQLQFVSYCPSSS